MTLLESDKPILYSSILESAGLLPNPKIRRRKRTKKNLTRAFNVPCLA